MFHRRNSGRNHRSRYVVSIHEVIEAGSQEVLFCVGCHFSSLQSRAVRSADQWLHAFATRNWYACRSERSRWKTHLVESTFRDRIWIASLCFVLQLRNSFTVIDFIDHSQVYSAEGRISFTSHTPGEHIICLYSNSTKWIGGSQLVRCNYEIDKCSLMNSAVNRQ